jgi:hypothetical protein
MRVSSGVSDLIFSMRAWTLLGALACSWNCGQSAPSSHVTAITIVPGRDALYVGEAADFRAVGSLSDGTTREVTGTWTVSGSALVQEAIPSRVRGARLGSASVLFTGESVSAARPLDVVDDLRGEWKGTLHYETCNRVSGEGPGVCKQTFGLTQYPEFSITTQLGRQFDIDFLISKSRGVFSGQAVVNRSVQIQDGVATWPGEHYGPHSYAFTNWSLRLEGPTGPEAELTGTVTVDRKWTNAWGPQHYNDLCTLKVKRQ